MNDNDTTAPKNFVPPGAEGLHYCLEVYSSVQANKIDSPYDRAMAVRAEDMQLDAIRKVVNRPVIYSGSPEHDAACHALRHAIAFSKAPLFVLARAAFVLPTNLIGINGAPYAFIAYNAPGLNAHLGDVRHGWSMGYLPAPTWDPYRFHKGVAVMHAEALARINAAADLAGWHEGHGPDSEPAWPPAAPATGSQA